MVRAREFVSAEQLQARLHRGFGDTVYCDTTSNVRTRWWTRHSASKHVYPLAVTHVNPYHTWNSENHLPDPDDLEPHIICTHTGWLSYYCEALIFSEKFRIRKNKNCLFSFNRWPLFIILIFLLKIFSYKC